MNEQDALKPSVRPYNTKLPPAVDRTSSDRQLRHPHDSLPAVAVEVNSSLLSEHRFLGVGPHDPLPDPDSSTASQEDDDHVPVTARGLVHFICCFQRYQLIMSCRWNEVYFSTEMDAADSDIQKSVLAPTLAPVISIDCPFDFPSNTPLVVPLAAATSPTKNSSDVSCSACFLVGCMCYVCSW